MNIRSLAAYERARRALRGVCEPSDIRRPVRFIVRVTQKKSNPYGNLLRLTCFPQGRTEQCFAYCVSSILPGEEMERAISTESVISRGYIPSGNTHTGISPKANICSLYAWQTSLPISERQMRTHILKIADFQGDPYGNLLRLTSFPQGRTEQCFEPIFAQVMSCKISKT